MFIKSSLILLLSVAFFAVAKAAPSPDTKLLVVADKTSLITTSAKNQLVYVASGVDAGFFKYKAAAIASNGGTALGTIVKSRSEAGSWYRVGVNNKLHVSWWGISPSVANNSAATQLLFDYAAPLGKHVFFDAQGIYKFVTGLKVQLAAVTSIAANRFKISGAGKGVTWLSGSTAGMTILIIEGDLKGTVKAFGYTELVTDISFVGGLGTNKTVIGLVLKGIAYTQLRNVIFSSLNTCLNLNAVLSSVFDSITFTTSRTGVVAEKVSSFSNANANLFLKCHFNSLRKLAYHGVTTSSQVVFESNNFEACGTPGDISTGAISLLTSGGGGLVGAVIKSSWFERNRGGFDVKVTGLSGVKSLLSISDSNFIRTDIAGFTHNNIVTVGNVRVISHANGFKSIPSFVYTRLYEFIAQDQKGEYLNRDSLYQRGNYQLTTAGTTRVVKGAYIASPLGEDVITEGKVTLIINRNGNSNIDTYALYVGTTFGGAEILTTYPVVTADTLTKKLTGLPLGDIYIRIRSKIKGVWEPLSNADNYKYKSQ